MAAGPLRPARRCSCPVYQQAVVLKTMPLNNATQITEAERARIARWFAHEAVVPPQ
ncbi:MAG: hypothetical protein ABIX12_16150 [Rubrivivax sp.]